LLIIIRRNIAAAEDGCRDRQGKERAEFFHDLFHLFFGMAENKSILSLTESILVICFTQILRNVLFARCLSGVDNASALCTDMQRKEGFAGLAVPLRTTRLRRTVGRFRQWRRAVAAVIPGLITGCRSRCNE
jgi:hypothetical protein